MPVRQRLVLQRRPPEAGVCQAWSPRGTAGGGGTPEVVSSGLQRLFCLGVPLMGIVGAQSPPLSLCFPTLKVSDLLTLCSAALCYKAARLRTSGHLLLDWRLPSHGLEWTSSLLSSEQGFHCSGSS